MNRTKDDTAGGILGQVECRRIVVNLQKHYSPCAVFRCCRSHNELAAV